MGKRITSQMPELLADLRRQADTFERIAREVRRLSNDAAVGLEAGELIERTARIQGIFLHALERQGDKINELTAQVREQVHGKSH